MIADTIVLVRYGHDWFAVTGWGFGLVILALLIIGSRDKNKGA